MFQASVEDTYTDFLTRVSEARGMSVQRVDASAGGRVWDGGAARQKGLVDQFGGLSDALEWVANKAGFEEPDAWHARFLLEPEDSTQAFLRQLLTSAKAPMAKAPASNDLFAIAARNREQSLVRIAKDLERLNGLTGVQAYCLECPAPGAQSLNYNPSPATIELMRSVGAK